MTHHQIPDFQLLLVGDGSERPLVEAGVRIDHWMQWNGARQGREKARCLRVASVVMAPFGIGLAVLDSFVSGAPIVATDSQGHGPEFACLKDGVNCVNASVGHMAGHFCDAIVQCRNRHGAGPTQVAA